MKTTRVLTLTAPEVDRLVDLVDELRRTGYVHASEIDVRLGNLARLAGSEGVSVLQIVRQRAPERAGLFLAPGLYAGRDGQIVRERENDAGDIAIGRFGWGKPIEVRCESGMEKHVMVEGSDPDGPDHFFSRDRWEDRNGRELQERGADAIRGAVGPWYPNWFAVNVPELLRLCPVAVQARVVRRLANDEELRAALDSARRLDGEDAVFGVLEEVGRQES